MTIKEITALRKGGHLEEALAAAENEFEKSQNEYTASALFWCLNDLCKQQAPEEAAATIDRMEGLFEDFGYEDEYMEKALASANRRSRKHYTELKDALENAKHGADAIAPHGRFLAYYNEGDLDPNLYQDFGWLTYYALKQTDTAEVQKRKILLGQYLKLNLPRPSLLHSLILGEAVKVEQHTPLQFRIRDFVRLWDLDNLRDEDWDQFRTDEGNLLSSLVEKLISVFSRELKTDRVEAPEYFIELVDKALERYPKSQNLPYSKATALISQGKTQEALAYYGDLIMRFPSKSYLWSQTAELVEEVDAKIGFLCKALLCGVEDEFLGRVRLRLAYLFYQKGLLSNAKHELEKYRETYQNKGWHLKSEYQQLYSQLASVPDEESNESVYAAYAARADEFVYSSLPTVLAVKVGESQSEDRFHPGRKITTWFLRTDDATLKLRKPFKLGLERRTPNGTAFDVKLQEDKIVWVKKHPDRVSAPWLKEFSGDVRLRTDRKGRKYAIISGAYVGEAILQGVGDGQWIKVLALQQADGRWAAISLMES